MFAGHVGIALAAQPAAPRLNLGLLAAAALLLDIVLWIFILLGWEAMTIPADFAATHQPRYVFPYSHSLLGAIAWSAAAGGAVFLAATGASPRRGRAAAIVGAVVFSHWVLDAIVHRPELPIAGTTSPLVGGGLWDHVAVALAFEAALLVAGLVLWARASRLPTGRLMAVGAIVLVTLAFTVAGMTVAPPPPSAAAMAASSLATIGILCGLLGWLGRAPTH
jgi:hypothetical protein